VHSRLDRSDRDVEDRGDIVVWHVLHVGKDQCDPELLGKRGEGGRDVDGARHIVGMIGRRRSDVMLRSIFSDEMKHGLAATPPEHGVASVDGDPVHPRGERRVTSKLVDSAQRRQERILRCVSGVVGVSEHSKAHVVQPAFVSADERGERRAVPFDVPPD